MLQVSDGIAIQSLTQAVCKLVFQQSRRRSETGGDSLDSGEGLLSGGCRQAKCLREKRARNRRARGSDSETRTLRRDRTVWSTFSDSVAEGAILGSLFAVERVRVLCEKWKRKNETKADD